MLATSAPYVPQYTQRDEFLSILILPRDLQCVLVEKRDDVTRFRDRFRNQQAAYIYNVCLSVSIQQTHYYSQNV